MADEREEVTLQALSRWIILALVLLLGLGLYFVVGRHTPPLIQPPELEGGP
jgi:hypothetical protein